LSSKSDKLGQNYNSVEEVILNRGTDLIIVGRGIYESKNIKETAQEYRERGWDSYLKRLKK
jgi:orotidine-5'-phosphate decarboxylase